MFGRNKYKVQVLLNVYDLHPNNKYFMGLAGAFHTGIEINSVGTRLIHIVFSGPSSVTRARYQYTCSHARRLMIPGSTISFVVFVLATCFRRRHGEQSIRSVVIRKTGKLACSRWSLGLQRGRFVRGW
jgi:hypothetical protein